LDGQYGHLICHHQKRKNCWSSPYEYKVLMITNTKCKICLSVLFKQASKCCLKCCDYAWLILVKNRFKEQVLKKCWFQNLEQTKDQFLQSVCTCKFFCFKLSSWSNKDHGVFLVLYFYILVNMPMRKSWSSTHFKWFFFLENISEHNFRAVLWKRCSGCSLAKLQKRFS